jgi:hypothetical protein
MAEVSKAVSRYFSRIGRAGGKKGGPKGGAERAKRLSPEERKAIARGAALERWSKERRCWDTVKGLRCLLDNAHVEPHRYP